MNTTIVAFRTSQLTTSNSHQRGTEVLLNKCKQEELHNSVIFVCAVTQSPWAAKSSKTVGYGRRILRCAVSDDLPTHFVRTEHIKRPEDLKPLPREVVTIVNNIFSVPF